MSIDDIEFIIQGGAVGVALFLAFILWKLMGQIITLVSNHLNHNTRALEKLSNLIDKLCEKIDRDK